MDEQRRRQMKVLSARLALAEAQRAPETESERAMSDATQVRVGLDVGNATAIIAVEVGGAVKVAKMPTAAAFSLALPSRLESDDHVFYDAHGVPSRAVGMAALRYGDGEVITARGSQDRYGAFMADFLVAGVASLVKASSIVVPVLAVTAPAKYYDEVKDVIVRALKRAHKKNYRGRAVAIDVQSVRVFKEGESALASLASLAKGPTILIEGGGGQTHVTLAKDGKPRADSVTRETGFQRVLDKVDDVILAKHRRRLTPLERWELEESLRDGKDYSIIISGQRTKVSHYADEQREEVAPLIINDVQSIVPKWRNFETVILAGGQAYHLKKEYSAAFPGLVVADRPTERNARGALILAGVVEASDEIAA